MASDQTSAILVARFLKANHYTGTLQAFLKEANLPEKAADTNSGDWTLEKLIEEKVQFDTSLKFERNDNEASQGWSKPAPSVASEPELHINANVLCVAASSDSKSLSISTANNTCSSVSCRTPYPTLIDQCFKADSPILSTTVYDGGHSTASTTMSGKLMIHKRETGQLLAERRDHSKWVVHVAAWTPPRHDDNYVLIATAGWDQRVHIYDLGSQHSDENGAPSLPPPAHSIALPSNPESMVFVINPDTGKLYLVVSRRDSSFLHYYRIETGEHTSPDEISVTPAGRQNLAPHSNAWVAFTPSALALHPSDPTLLAIATSHLPHLKVILVRLLFPDTPSTQGFIDAPPPQTQAAMARADLALQDREDAAITLQVSTQAPQTPYSTPQIAWRPDGSGVWVNGDDGVIRGVEAKTGKVVALLRAHEAASKVRTLWAGLVDDREILISGGFDRKCFIWEVAKEGSEAAS
ncbi:hypothetical protein PMZ80_006858 [Knufia obscura]|uniref:LisH domain-containing protein n=2 Tax=Knufia TaxID=430999 RepID=A0AAN8ERQ9_9EURO|nr:hypothetical protein PMZ80_006858 [Knufia obscura]KAK5957398.1 hypothetical protein OHC33_001772 [Knufia fluminis]